MAKAPPSGRSTLIFVPYVLNILFLYEPFWPHWIIWPFANSYSFHILMSESSNYCSIAVTPVRPPISWPQRGDCDWMTGCRQPGKAAVEFSWVGRQQWCTYIINTRNECCGRQCSVSVNVCAKENKDIVVADSGDYILGSLAWCDLWHHSTKLVD